MSEVKCDRCHQRPATWQVRRDEVVIEVICGYCSGLECLERYRATGVLTSHLLLTALLGSLHNSCREISRQRLRPEVTAFYERFEDELDELARVQEELNDAVKTFEQQQWGKVLQPYYQASVYTQHSGTGDGFVLLLAGSAGRVLVTLRSVSEPTTQITMIFADREEARGGVQSVQGTREAVLSLLTAATQQLPVLTPNREVSIA